MYKVIFLVLSFVATGLAQSPTVTISVSDTKGSHPDVSGSPLQISNLDLVDLKIDFDVPKDYVGQTDFRLQAPVDNSPYADASRNDVAVNVNVVNGAPLSPKQVIVSEQGGGSRLRGQRRHFMLTLLLKIPTEITDRVVRAKTAYEKALATDAGKKIDPRSIAAHPSDELAASVAAYVVDSKVGTYSANVAVKDPRTGANLTSNTVSFTIVDHGYPEAEK